MQKKYDSLGRSQFTQTHDLDASHNFKNNGYHA